MISNHLSTFIGIFLSFLLQRKSKKITAHCLFFWLEYNNDDNIEISYAKKNTQIDTRFYCIMEHASYTSRGVLVYADLGNPKALKEKITKKEKRRVCIDGRCSFCGFIHIEEIDTVPMKLLPKMSQDHWRLYPVICN
jgi:hypothetical protein